VMESRVECLNKLFVDKIKKMVLMFGCVLLAGILAFYSDLSFPKAAVLLMIGYSIFCWKQKWISGLILVAALLLFGVYHVRFFNETLYPLKEAQDAGQDRLLTQITIPGSWENHDMWISPVVEGKTVDLTYAGAWCHRYFAEFAAETVLHSEAAIEIDTIYMKGKLEYFVDVNAHYFVGTRDFFRQEELEAIYRDENEGHVFLALDGLTDADMVCVITDEAYNVYMMSKEVLEKVLDGYEG